MSDDMLVGVLMTMGILAWMVMAWLLTAVVGHVVANRLGGQGGFGLLLLNLIPALAVPGLLRYAGVIVVRYPHVSPPEIVPGLFVLLVGMMVLGALYILCYLLPWRKAVVGAALTMTAMGVVSVVVLVPAVLFGFLLFPLVIVLLPLLAIWIAHWGVMAIWSGLPHGWRPSTLMRPSGAPASGRDQ